MAAPGPAGRADGDTPGLALDEHGNRLQLSGEWTLARFAQLRPQVALARRQRCADLSGIRRLDSAGALLIATLLQQGDLAPDDIDGASAEQQALIRATLATLRPVSHPPLRRWGDFLHRVGQASVELLDQARRLLGFVGQVTATLPGVIVRPRRWRLTSLVHHIEQVGLDALPIIALLTFMVGAVITFLGAVVLRDFGASVFAVELVSFSFLREFGVLLTAILLAGHCQRFTAQIGR